MRQAAIWENEIQERVTLGDTDRALVDSVVENIFERWHAGDPTGDKGLFSARYNKHKELAQGAVIAIVELVRAVGRGEIPEGWVQ